MAHWRTMAKAEYFCAADLWDESAQVYRNAVVQIVDVKQGEVVGQKGRKKGMPMLSLVNRRGGKLRAPFGSNPTNCKTISNVLGTPNVQKWVGHWIELTVAKVDGPEGIVDAIRVSPRAPAPPAEGKLEPKHADAPPSDPGPAAEMSDEDRRAVELAEAEEARRG